MRTPHLRTKLTAKEVAYALREAAQEVDSLALEIADLKAALQTSRAGYDNLLKDYHQAQDDLKSLKTDRVVLKGALKAQRERYASLLEEYNQQAKEISGMHAQIQAQATTIRCYQEQTLDGIQPNPYGD